MEMGMPISRHAHFFMPDESTLRTCALRLLRHFATERFCLLIGRSSSLHCGWLP
jgi:hypothetical protein